MRAMREVIPANEAAELRKLYRDLPPLIWEATNAIKCDPPALTLRGSDLDRFRQRDAEVSAIMARIRQITDQ